MDTRGSLMSQKEQPNQKTVSVAGISSAAATSHVQVPSSYKDERISGSGIEIPSGSKPNGQERSYGLTGRPHGADGILPSVKGHRISRVLRPDVRKTVPAASILQDGVDASVAPKLDAMRISEPQSGVSDDTTGKGTFPLPSQDDSDASAHNFVKVKAHEIDGRLSPAKEMSRAEGANAVKKNQIEARKVRQPFEVQSKCSAKEEEAAKADEREAVFMSMAVSNQQIVFMQRP